MYKLIILMIISVVSAHGHSCQSRQFLHEGRCCDMCMPGMHVERNCTMTVQTTCKFCEVGTVTNGWNAKSTCSNCPGNKYYDINLSYCMPCRTCPKGQYPMKTCSKILNTQCSICPENHYSNVSENTNTPCKACTSCKKFAKLCTKEDDSICDNTEITTQPPRTILTSQSTNKLMTEPNLITTTAKAKTSHSDVDGDNTYKILAAVLVSLFIVLLLVVFLVARKKSRRCQRGRGGFPLQTSRMKYEPLKTGLLLRNQPASMFLKLVELLNPEGRRNWKDLAAEFNDFSWDDIANFAVDKSTAAEKMLCSWQVKNIATVDKLHDCCIAIGREDVATYVADFFCMTATDTPV